MVSQGVKMLMLAVFISARALLAQVPEGVGQGYEGELAHVSRQLIALAEATPPEKFAWRPAPGVRSTSEVYMHIAIANFYFLSVTGRETPADLKPGAERSISSKPAVVEWLKRSLEAVKTARATTTPKEMKRKVRFLGRDATVDGIYLRLIIHNNEHMGQLIAYARMTGVVPPWSKQ